MINIFFSLIYLRSSIKRPVMIIGLSIFIQLLSLHAESQSTITTKNKSPFPVKYTSLIDQKMLLKIITLAPVYDNINNIYAEPIQKLLVDLLQSDKVWGYSEYPEFNKKIFVEKFDSQPNDVLEILTKTNAQALLTAFITKGPRGLNAKLKLFTQDQGFLLIEESFEDLDIFEISKIREKFITMYHNIKSKLPYRGYVLSRRGLEVTLNLGSINGVQLGQELTLAQILKLNRHPKLKIIVGVEKEIIAKVKITKVESYLSFAQIVFEKETGVVDVGAKILPTTYVSYPMPKTDSQGNIIGDQPIEPPNDINQQNIINQNLATDKSLETQAENEKNNLLDKHNSTGLITLQGAITQYSEATELTAGASASSSNSFAPGFYFGTQLNLLKNIFIGVNTQINTFGGDNSLAGSTPFQLSFTLNRTSASIGYDYKLIDDENPEDDPITLTAALAIVKIKTNVSTTTPTALTSTQTDSLALQLKATMPISIDMPLIVGGGFDIYVNPSFTESPVTAGTGKTSITSFDIFGLYPISDYLRLRADFNLMSISTSFSGTGTRTNPAFSTSIQTLSERIGIEYLF